MLPYSRSLILDNNNSYGIVKTETLFGFGPSSQNVNYNQSDALEWILTPVNLEKSIQETPRKARSIQKQKQSQSKTSPLKTKNTGKKAKKIKRTSKKVNKCIFKVLKKKGGHGGGGGGGGSGKKRGKFKKLQKKYMMPVILGLLAAKSVLIPVALKALAFISAKGLMMGFFSTVMASVLSLKGMFDTSNKYHDRKDEKTQVEIIQVPTKGEHYYDDHYRRTDFLPLPLPE